MDNHQDSIELTVDEEHDTITKTFRSDLSLKEIEAYYSLQEAFRIFVLNQNPAPSRSVIESPITMIQEGKNVKTTL
jgi:hypothetical protein